jgi:hypothetical protein
VLPIIVGHPTDVARAFCRDPHRHLWHLGRRPRGQSRELGHQVPRQALPQASLHYVSAPRYHRSPPGSPTPLCSPTGSNPTGCSSPLARKEKILALARKHNLLILEDDAYAFLHFNPAQQAPSYIELEGRDGGETGRVIRFDSMSKILSSGMRIGFLTGPKEVVDVVDLITANTNLQPR